MTDEHVTMHEVESSNIYKWGWQEIEPPVLYRHGGDELFHSMGRLHVSFRSKPDQVYVYDEMPACLYDLICLAKSPGAAINRLIKPHYEVVETIPPAQERLIDG